MVETWQIIVGIGLLILGGGIGALLRPGDKKLRARNDELESQLTAAKEGLASQQSEVAKHFEQTSDLFRDLTHQYTSLYAHLADGARSLVPDQMIEIGQGFNLPQLGDRAEDESEPSAEEDEKTVSSTLG